jgi:hypothetical protein
MNYNVGVELLVEIDEFLFNIVKGRLALLVELLFLFILRDLVEIVGL